MKRKEPREPFLGIGPIIAIALLVGVIVYWKSPSPKPAREPEKQQAADPRLKLTQACKDYMSRSKTNDMWWLKRTLEPGVELAGAMSQALTNIEKGVADSRKASPLAEQIALTFPSAAFFVQWMHMNPETNVISRKRLWTGRVLSALGVLFMLFDAGLHIAKPQYVVDAFNELGYSPDIAVPLGIIVLVCLALYLYPKTSVLGCILMTGYLGGAVATNARIEAPLFTHILFPVYVGILFWGGLYLRDRAISDLIPLRK